MFCCITNCYCAELSDWMCFDHQNLLCRYKKLFLVMGGPVNTGYRVVSLLPHWKTVTFPQFTFAHSYLFYLSLKILILWIKHLCYAQLNKCRWMALVNHTWHCLDLKQTYIILGVLWHLWAKINPNNIQQDFRGWTWGESEWLQRCKKWQLSNGFVNAHCRNISAKSFLPSKT